MRWRAGVDGKFNDGSRKALNYLLYGSSGPEIEQSNRNNPELEDMIAVVSAGMCFLYVGKKEVHERLLPLVGEVAGLQLFTLYDEEAQDMDLSEERKILSFLEMVEPFKAIGTELTPGYDAGSGKGPAMELENWPLIQVLEDPSPLPPKVGSSRVNPALSNREHAPLAGLWSGGAWQPRLLHHEARGERCGP
jgi:hypothetical protein